MEMTNEKILSLFSAFKGLNGREVVVTGENDKQRTVFEPYQFDAKTCWNIAKNLNVLKRHVEAFDEARKKLVESIGGSKGLDEKNTEQVDTLDKGLKEILNEKVTVEGLLKIKFDGLKLDKNAIQPGTLAGLTEYIED